MISTHLLTVLIKCCIVILQVEQEQKEVVFMNINKFTQKSLQAVQDCERIASDYGNQEIAQEHLLYALLTQDDSLIAWKRRLQNARKYRVEDSM